MIRTLLAAPFVAFALAVTACGEYQDPPKSSGNASKFDITRTSQTTFRIRDDESFYPERQLSRTCETVGMVVIGQTTHPYYEDILLVTCGPKPTGGTQ